MKRLLAHTPRNPPDKRHMVRLMFCFWKALHTRKIGLYVPHSSQAAEFLAYGAGMSSSFSLLQAAFPSEIPDDRHGSYAAATKLLNGCHLYSDFQ